MPRQNPLFGQYRLECTHPGCSGRALIDQAMSAGLRVGDIVPEDSSNPNFGRCPLCRRCMMKVVEAPPGPEPILPQGFSRIPTE
jgi:hypothetical protein